MMRKPTQLIYIILIYCLIFAPFSKTQGQSPADTILAQAYLERTIVLADEGLEDSMSWYLLEAARLYQQAGLHELFLQKHVSDYQYVYESGYFTPVIEAMNAIVASSRKQLGDSHPALAPLYYHLGRALQFRGDNAEALDWVMRCLTLQQSIQPTPWLDIAYTHNLMGVCYIGLYKFSEAITQYNKALDIRKRELGPRHPLTALVINNLGSAHGYFGLNDIALKYYQEALSIREEVLPPDHPHLGISIFNLATLYSDLGLTKKAIELYQKAMRIYQLDAEANDELIGDVYQNLGVEYQYINAFEEALAHLQQARIIYERQPEVNPEKLAFVAQNIASTLSLQGNYRASIDESKAAMGWFRKQVDSIDFRFEPLLTNMGMDYAAMTRLDSSLQYHYEALNVLSHYPDAIMERGNVYSNIGNTYLRMGDYEQALVAQEEALKGYTGSLGNRHERVAYALNEMAATRLKQGLPRQAFALAQRALEANYPATFSNDPPPEAYFSLPHAFNSCLLKAKAVLGMEGNASLAALYYRQADSLLLYRQQILVSKEDKINLAKETWRLSSVAVANNVAMWRLDGNPRHLEEAFYYAERCKANVLLSSVAAYEATQFAGLPDSLANRENELRALMVNFQQQLSAGADSLTRLALQEALLTNSRQYRALIDHLEKNYPLYYDLKYEKGIPTVGALQTSLEPDEAFVSYFTADTVLYIFKVTKTGFSVHEQFVGADFYDHQEGLRKSITLQLDEVYLQKARLLYKMLFPFEWEEGINKLILAPDDALVKLPFETLLREDPTGSGPVDYSNLAYLLRDFAVSYSPSAAFCYRRANAPKLSDDTQGFLGCAPVFEEEFSPDDYALASRTALERLETDLRGGALSGRRVKPLPGTARETQAVSQLFTSRRLPTTVLLHAFSTEAKLRAELAKPWRFVHLASHGLINEKYPDLSGILLYPDTLDGQDGLLTAGEVYNLSLQADLVALSACETGLGRISGGEGLLGLTRAFLYAGANNLLASLWKVQDRASADLMIAFYEYHLISGTNAFAPALQQAKLQLIEDGEYSHPFYWSPFILIGK